MEFNRLRHLLRTLNTSVFFFGGQAKKTDAMPFVVVFLNAFVFLTSLSRHIREPFGPEPGVRMKKERPRVRIRGRNVAERRRGRS